jgi:hypothetical protein
MGNMDKYTKPFAGKKRDHEPEEQHRGLGCAAHGCGRLGTVSRSAGHDAKYLCWIHDMVKDPMDFPKITEAINENAGLINIIDRVTRISMVELEHGIGVGAIPKQPEIDSYFKSKGMPELARRWKDEAAGKREPKIYWVMRLRNYGWWVVNGCKPEERKRVLA